MFATVFVVINFLVALLPSYSLACNGYEYKLLEFKPCSDNNVIQFKDPRTTLDSDCIITPTGCMTTDGFKTAMMHYRINKKPMPIIEGDFDLCKGLADNDEYALLIANVIGLPKSCPVEKTEICGTGDDKISIEKYKSKLGLALGVAEVNLTITHDVGQTCVAIKAEFTKPRKG